MKKRYFVSVDCNTIYDLDNHWICDCGHWTTGEDNYHIPIQQGLRNTAYMGLTN